MDNVTHTLFALTLARTPLRRAGRGTTAALVLASNAPDVDFVSLARGGASYMHWHRGPTHGPLGVLGLGLLSAGLVWAWPRLKTGDRRLKTDGGRPKTSPASFPMLAAIAMLAIVLHIAMDVPTSYGTRMFSPFDWHWYAFDWLPIVDLYLLIALAAGLFFGRESEAAGRRNAAIVLALMAANYGLRAVAHHEALALAPRVFGPTLPARCPGAPDTSSILDRWPREVRLKADTADTTAAARTVVSGFSRTGRCLVEIAAVPTFTSPLDWRVIAQTSNSYELRDVSLTDPRLRTQASEGEVLWRQSVRYPNVWTAPAESAAHTRVGQIFLGFSRFPAVRSFSDASGATVRFIDMRFAAGLVALMQPVQRPSPFSVTIQLAPDGRVVRESFGR